VKEPGRRSLAAIVSGDLPGFGRLMHELWRYKKQRSPRMPNADIDCRYDMGMANGALGGFLIF